MKPHRARILAMQAIFQKEFREAPLEELTKFRWIDFPIPEEEVKMATEIIGGTLKHQKYLDELIQNYSENWAFERISPVNKAILRICLYQLLSNFRDIAPKVVLSEAVLLSKEYSEEDSKRFINGILDKVYSDFKGGVIQKI